MNISEKQILQRKLGVYQRIIKSQMKHPKSKRDYRKLQHAKLRSSIINKWLNDKKK